jgi:FkbM family methyltransferase
VSGPQLDGASLLDHLWQLRVSSAAGDDGEAGYDAPRLPAVEPVAGRPNLLAVGSGADRVEFRSSGNWLSRLTNRAILQGQTYRPVPFVRDVRVVMDVGANVGATTLFFSHVYPHARVFAFEPGHEAYGLLRANTEHRDNVQAFNFGLFSTDKDVPLFHGAQDSGTSSVAQTDETGDESEVVHLRSVRRWLERNEVDRVDVLKVDTEGCEVPILEALGPLVGSTKVLYVEFHSEDDRRSIDRLVEDTHVLAFGGMVLNTGELTYIARSAFPSPEAVRRGAIRVDI